MRALRNAVAQGTEGHAYLFSGPRGTGKTSTARILARALNCTALVDGEPCGECESCRSIEAGGSYDLFELDAASNNGVDAMRDLIARAAVGSPGRTKVYILDEVHMLSAAASNALLKTLEEPPEHVKFVLATTDPQKVLPTIRSRTQHFEFSLLTAAELEDYVRWIIGDAGLDVDEDSIAAVVRQGRGSARDTLSALDLAVAAGGLSSHGETVEVLAGAIADHEVGAALAAVAAATAQGREPRLVAETLVATLRDAFLVAVGGEVGHLADVDRLRLAELAKRAGTAALTRGIELVGSALVDMRQASDPRVPLEVALVRLCEPKLDASPAALLERIERLERQLARGGTAPLTTEVPAAPDRAPAAPTATASPSAAPAGSDPVVDDDHDHDGTDVSDAAGVRAQLARRRGPTPPTTAAAAPAPPRPAAPPRPPAPPRGGPPPTPPTPPTPPAPPAPAPPPAAPTPSAPEPAPSAPGPAASPSGPAPTSPPTPAAPPSPTASTGGLPTRDELALAMGDAVLGSLKGIAKAIYSGGRFVTVEGDHAVFALNNAPTRERAEKVRPEVEAALATHFGRPVPLRLVDESEAATRGGPGSPPEAGTAAPAAAPAVETPAVEDHHDEHEDIGDVRELEDATDVATSGIDKLVQAFPGAEVVNQEEP